VDDIGPQLRHPATHGPKLRQPTRRKGEHLGGKPVQCIPGLCTLPSPAKHDVDVAGLAL
jgi:hypothetical protein